MPSRTMWTDEKQPGEHICTGCGKLCDRSDVTLHAASGTTAEINDDGIELDHDHATLGILTYCIDCMQYRAGRNIRIGAHAPYWLRDDLRPSSLTRYDGNDGDDGSEETSTEQTSLPGLTS